MAIIRFLIILFFYGQLNAQNTDINLLRKFHNPQALKSDPFFRFTSNSVAPIAIAVPLTYFGAGLTQKDRSIKTNLNFQHGINTGISVLSAGLFSYSLKYTIQRKRPYVSYNDIQAKMHTGPFSFPSGHTTFAFATATSMALNHKKWYAAAPVFIWAVGVGYSRLHLGVHFPSDVLVGALIGTGSSILTHALTKKLYK